VSCNGAADGAIDLTVAGGADCVAYSYNWSTGATTEDVSGLAAGTYGVTVTDANGCSASSTFTLTEPAVLVGSGVRSSVNCGYNIACNGGTGSIDYAVSGGCAPYSYLWSNGATTEDVSGLAAGTHGVTVTDANGCSTSNSFTLTQPEALAFTCPTNTTVYLGWPPLSCATLSVTNVTGGCGPYTYAWSDGATTASTTVCPTVSTDYTVTVTDANGCSESCTVRVCVIDVRCGQNLQKIEICHNPSGNNPQTLCINPNAFTINAHLQHGDHLGSCGSDVPCAAPLKSDGGAEAGAAHDHDHGMGEMEAYPNPFSDVTTVRFMLPEGGEARLEVYSLTGERVAVLFEGMVEAGLDYEVEWKPEQVSQGIYFARLTTSHGEVVTKKLVLNR
jgi:hypothetical protein